MTASTLDAPAANVEMRFVVEGPPVGALWRRALLRAVLVPLPVLAPLIALAPSHDHRFNIYWHGALFRDDPAKIVPHTVDSLPGYLQLGNFRLFGRMVEKSLDVAAYTLAEVAGVPANVGLRLVSFVAAMLLCLTAVLVAECVVARGPLFRRPPSTLAAVLPFGVAAGFVAAGGASPVVVFGGLYHCSAALVLAVVALVCRVDFAGRFRLWWGLPLLAGGAALASFNELAYLALPLATAAVAARGRLVLGVPWRRLLTGPPARALALLWLGFVPVFIAVRVVIQRYCSVRTCYHGSDIVLGPEVAQAFGVRAIAWLPPLLWRGATAGGSDRPWVGGVVLFATVAVLGTLAWLTIRDLPRLSAVSRPAALAVVVTGGTLVVLGAALAALNGDVQQLVGSGHWGRGWRDSAVTTTAGALVVAGAAHLVRGHRWLPVVLILLLTVGATVSAAANKRFRDTAMARPPAKLANRLAQEMADFDRTPAGAARRCTLRAEFFALHRDAPFSLSRFDKSLDTAARQRAGEPFCPGVTR